MNRPTVFRDFLGLVIGNEKQIRASEFSAGAEQGRNLSLARTVTGDRIGDLNQLNDFPMSHKTEINVVRLISVIEDFRIIIRPMP